MGLSNLPSVDEVINDPEIMRLINYYTRAVVVGAIRRELDIARRILSQKESTLTRPEIKQQTVKAVCSRLLELEKGSLKEVINATGVILHTNLGRAVLSERAAEAVKKAALSYTNLEIDLIKGERGSRYSHVEPLLTALLDCEAALVVNNNAAAVLLALNTLAAGKKVIVSRGQLVEIGGSFRIPEIMKMSGARLVEVGTTNKTYLRDYEEAIDEETALLLSVHTSNFRIIGFSQEVPLNELSMLGIRRGIPVMHDLGSGTMLDITSYGLGYEPTVKSCLAGGADIVTFSGDKLLGGPQSGIIAGRKKYIDMMKKNHLLRALRVDKLTIAGLEATLAEYIKNRPQEALPVYRMLAADKESLLNKAQQLAGQIRTAASERGIELAIEVHPVQDMVGGGAVPAETLPGYGVTVIAQRGPEEIAFRLRTGEPAVLPRIQNQSLIFHVRTLLPGQEEKVVMALVNALEGIVA